jgi:bacterioferritin-associated ferredoxin
MIQDLSRMEDAMNFNDEKRDPEYEICLCRHVTRAEIEKIIRQKKPKNLQELCEVANVGNKCGGCREDLEMVLNDVYSGNAVTEA